MTGERCAYLVSRYPGITHTFVVGEVRALRAAGVDVATASVRRLPDAEVLSELDAEEQRRTHALLPAGPLRVLGAHLGALRHSPRAYGTTLVRALRLSHAGGRPRLWQLFYFAEAILLWRWMRGAGLRHVHVHFANVASDVAMLACGFANAAGAQAAWTWSLTIHGPVELLDATGHKLAAKVRDAAAAVCISDYAASQVAALVEPSAMARVHTVRCGIDVSAFAPADRGGPRDGVTVLCVGALSRRKGHHVLLEAMARVHAVAPDCRLVVVGDGDEREALEAQAAALGLTAVVSFAGAVGHDRVPELYAAADLFCLPSFAEGVPTVLMEAMATELPVVATSIMGVPELVEHERSGLLVAPARADLLADAVVRLAGDPALRERMGREGRRRVLADYERGAAAERLHAVLAPLIRTG